MANYRPAGLSDDDSDSDLFECFSETPIPSVPPEQLNPMKVMENTLQDAIANGNIQVVENIIHSDLKDKVNLKLNSGWTPLLHACFHGQDDIVKLLLKLGADPNLHSDSVTPVMAACSNATAKEDNIFNIITMLLKEDCILNVGDKYGQTALMRAISSGYVSVVQKLLDMNVNIEMRDHQGWTAVFYAAHHNRPEILEMLIERGARLTEVDRSNRTPMEIAETHDHQCVIDVLEKHVPCEDDETDANLHLSKHLTSYFEFYTDVIDGKKPTYTMEIPYLLYGMKCENLVPLFQKSGMDLETFLLLEENDLIQLGVDMPYERLRIVQGLRQFHERRWKINAVHGLYARKVKNYTVSDCLGALGGHLYQLYILNAALRYVLREYTSIHRQIKAEPPDSPVLEKMQTSARRMITNIKAVKGEIGIMNTVLKRIRGSSCIPSDLITEKTTRQKIVTLVNDFVALFTIGIVVYHARNHITGLLKK